MPYCFFWSSIKFQGHKGWKIDDLNPICVRLLGRSQLSNPSDLPCLYPVTHIGVCVLWNYSYNDMTYIEICQTWQDTLIYLICKIDSSQSYRSDIPLYSLSPKPFRYWHVNVAIKDDLHSVLVSASSRWGGNCVMTLGIGKERWKQCNL